MLTIPTANKNQEFNVVLAGQVCRITIYENSTGVYLDLYKNGDIVRKSMLCLNNQPMVTEEYHDFIGQLMFEDIQGDSDPTIDLVGSRYQLRYLELGVDI